MALDKNSSPRRELGLYPKITTKDSHTSLSRSRSHNGPTNPRNKPPNDQKVKAKLKEAKDLAVPRTPWQTVRNPGADGPRSPGGRSAAHGWTVH
jgi:hypothetical protein